MVASWHPVLATVTLVMRRSVAMSVALAATAVLTVALYFTWYRWLPRRSEAP